MQKQTQKIIIVFDKNKEKCNKICYFVKGFIENVCTVHPLYYFEYCTNNDKKYKVYRRVINFISRNKHKKYIIIDNYFEEYLEHLLYQLKIKGYPVTHFICEQNISIDIQNWFDIGLDKTKIKEYLSIENNNIIKNKIHPRLVFLSLMKGSKKYNVIRSYVKEYESPKYNLIIGNDYKSPKYVMFFVKKNSFLFDDSTSDIYLISPVEEDLKKKLKTTFQLLLQLKDSFNNKLDFSIVSIFKNWKKMETSIGLFTETEKYRIL